MADASKSTRFDITADGAQFVSEMKRCADATTGAAGNIKTAFDGVGKAFEAVQSRLLMITAIVGGGKFFKDAIAASNQFTGETNKLSQRLGITGDAAGALNVALKRMGSDSDTYIGAFDQFAKQIKKNEQGLQDFGLRTRDANGNLRDSQELFTEAVQTIGQYKPGLDQTTAAMTLFGKSVDEVMKLQRLNADAMEAARVKQEQLGLVTTPQNIAAGKAYRLAMADVNLMLTAIQKTVGDAVMPVFTELAQYFASTGPDVIAVFKGALTGLMAAFRGVQAAVRTVVAVVSESFNQIIEQGSNLGELLSALFSGDFKGAGAVWERIKNRFVQGVTNVVDATKDAFSDASRAMTDDLSRIWDKKTAAGSPKGGDKTMGDLGKEQKDRRMNDWEAVLEERKLKIAEEARAEGTFREMSKADELAYWEAIRAAGNLTRDELIAIRRKIAGIGLELNKQEFEARLESLKIEREAAASNFTERSRLAGQAYLETAQRYGAESKEAKAAYGEVLAEHRRFVEQSRALDQSAADARRAALTANIELQRTELQMNAQLGLVDKQQALQAESTFEQQLYQIKVDALRERLALIDQEKDPVAWDTANRAIEAAEIQHTQRMAQLAADQHVAVMQPWTSMLDAMGSGWAGLMDKVLRGTIGLGGLVRGVFAGIATAVAQTLEQIAAKWLLEQVRRMVFGKLEALSAITRLSGEAGAGGVASMAAAPFPLNLAAPAFGASMAAAAMAFAPVAAASGGFDVPNYASPITQLHPSEMVLPAHLANPLRDMIASGGGGDGSGAGVQVTIAAHPMPGNYFMVHRDQLVAALKASKREFARGI